jgi:hypothetical protein
MNAALKHRLVQSLELIGLERTVIPGFLKNFSNAVSIRPDLHLRIINQRLKLIGWNDIELDDYTCELARIRLEAQGITDRVYKPSNWFEKAFFAQ